jgi:hypothetical protein
MEIAETTVVVPGPGVPVLSASGGAVLALLLAAVPLVGRWRRWWTGRVG